MERELKKIPAYFKIYDKWFEYAAKMTQEQKGKAFNFILLYSNRMPVELPEDPAAYILSLIMKDEVDKIFEAVENGEFPFYYVDEDGNRVGEIQNATPEDLEQVFTARATREALGNTSGK